MLVLLKQYFYRKRQRRRLCLIAGLLIIVLLCGFRFSGLSIFQLEDYLNSDALQNDAYFQIETTYLVDGIDYARVCADLSEQLRQREYDLEITPFEEPLLIKMLRSMIELTE